MAFHCGVPACAAPCGAWFGIGPSRNGGNGANVLDAGAAGATAGLGASPVCFEVAAALGASAASASIAAASEGRDTTSPSFLPTASNAGPEVAFLLAGSDALAMGASVFATPAGTNAANAGAVAGTAAGATTVSGGLMEGRRACPGAVPSPRSARCCLIETTPRSSLFVSETCWRSARGTSDERCSGMNARGASSRGLCLWTREPRRSVECACRRAARCPAGDAVRRTSEPSIRESKSGKARPVTCQVGARLPAHSAHRES